VPAIDFLGYYVAQTWSALTMINKVLSESKDITRILELGTGTGGLTLLFGLNMLVRRGYVLTFDLGTPQALNWFPRLNTTFKPRDVFDEDTIRQAETFLEGGRALVFCDNGDKTREFPIYTRFLKKDDLIMAHDWTTEIKPEDLDEETLSLVEPYLQDEFDEAFTLILSMRRI